MRVRSRLAVGLLVTAAGCRNSGGSLGAAVVDTLPRGTIRVTSRAAVGWSDSARAWAFEEVQRIGDSDGSAGEILKPISIALDEWGRVYVSDAKPAGVKMFGRDGHYIRTVGREGAGPGEYRTGFVAAGRGVVVVHDPQQSRTSVFDTTGAFLRSWAGPCCYWFDIGLDSAGVVTVAAPGKATGGKPGGLVYLRSTLDGKILDTIPIPKRSDGKRWNVSDAKGNAFMSMPVPFTPQVLQTIAPTGGVIHGWSGDFQIAEIRRPADTARLIRREWIPDPIPDALRRAAVEERVAGSKETLDEAALRRIFRLDDIPTKSPAFTDIRADRDGNIWTRRLVGSDSTETTYDVFDRTGAWLGATRLRAGIHQWGVQTWGHGELVAVIEDTETGQPTVVRWRIRKP